MEDAVKITLLGTGNAFHDDGFAHQSILLETTGLHFCVDCGSTAVMNMVKYGFRPADLDGILLTHFHGDHIAGIPFLLLRLQRDDHRTRIIGPAGTRDRITRLVDLLYPGSELAEQADFEEVPSAATRYTVCDGLVVDIIQMIHSEESIGYRIYLRGKTIAVSGDTAWTESLIHLCSRADVAFLECTAVDNLEEHITVREIRDNIDRLDAGVVGFVHTSQQVRDALSSWNHPRIRVLEDGDELRL